MENILQEIKEERKRQDEKWGGSEHDDQLLQWEWGDCILRHNDMGQDVARKILSTFLSGGKKLQVVEFTEELSVDKGANFRKQMIRVAALAVAAVESLDRRTAGSSL